MSQPSSYPFVPKMGENILAPAGGGKFNLEEYMTSVGRNPRPVKRRADVPELPTPQSLGAIYDGWLYLPQLMRHDGDWRVAINTMYGGNSYFAAVAMLIFGDPKWWFWVRIQHLQYFEQVITIQRGEPAHPRHGLYKRFSGERSGPNNFNLQERMATADCWVDHQEGTPSLPVFNEVYTAVQARGNYNSPHLFLRYTDNRHYQPIVPSGVPHPSEFRAPQFSLTGIISLALILEGNKGVLHPWRKPYPDVPVPGPLVPTPITTLVLTDLDKYLEEILWVKFGEQLIIWTLPCQQPARGRDHDRSESSQIFNIQGGGGDDGITVDITNNGSAITSSRTTYNVETPDPSKLAPLPATPQSTINYYAKPLKVLESLIAERSIKIPEKVKRIKDDEERRKWYAAYLEGHDLELGAGGKGLSGVIDFADGPRKVTTDNTTTQITTRQERAGGVLRQIITTTIIRTITSVPTSRIPIDDPVVPKNGKIDFHTLSEEELQKLLLGVKLEVTGDRETDIDTYRAWRKQPARTGPSKMQVRNESSGKGEGVIDFNTTINVNIYPRSVLGKRSRSLHSLTPSSSTTATPAPDPPEEHLEVGERHSSPEPKSPVANDYSNWSAAALKRNANARNPPIKVPAKQRAAETVRVLGSQLQALDSQSSVARNMVREAKRSRAKTRKEGAKGGERPMKRLKLIAKDDGREKGMEGEVEEVDEHGDGNDGFSASVHGTDNMETGDRLEEAEVGKESGTPARQELVSEVYEGFEVETPGDRAGGGD